MFNEVVAALRAIGPVKILPEKTRIAFQVRMSFAQVTPRRAWLDGLPDGWTTRDSGGFRPFRLVTTFMLFA
jgi:hypothetical protein